MAGCERQRMDRRNCRRMGAGAVLADGFIPLAYLLENNDMIARAKKYIDAIISFSNRMVGFARVKPRRSLHMIHGRYF